MLPGVHLIETTCVREAVEQNIRCGTLRPSGGRFRPTNSRRDVWRCSRSKQKKAANTSQQHRDQLSADPLTTWHLATENENIDSIPINDEIVHVTRTP